MHADFGNKESGGADALAWIADNLELRPCGSTEFLYEHMESQSGESLPPVYVPFDGRRHGHFADRGQILDFALSAGVADGKGRVLDFGPGDGWPALLMAPMVGEVVGVEGCRRRVEVCTANADRLGIANARFVHVPPGTRLPFDDESFDGVTASSSVEQTPDPQATLRELQRVLKPGGRLRIHYESLSRYAGGRERDLWLFEDAGRARLVIYDRHVKDECVENYGLAFAVGLAAVKGALAGEGGRLAYDGLRPEALSRLSGRLVDACVWTTRHPSCGTLLRWLAAAGFSSARPTYDGGWFAGELFERLSELERPTEAEAVDELLRPVVEVVVGMEAAAASVRGEWDHWVTAVK